jgi:hypothetical protein
MSVSVLSRNPVRGVYVSSLGFSSILSGPAPRIPCKPHVFMGTVRGLTIAQGPGPSLRYGHKEADGSAGGAHSPGEGPEPDAHFKRGARRSEVRMPFRNQTQEQLKAEEYPLLKLLAQVEETVSELGPDSPWYPCLSRAARSLRRGLGL